LVGFSPPASAACDPAVQRSYSPAAQDWIGYESIVVGTSPVATVATLTHNQTISGTASITGDVGASVGVVVADIQSKVSVGFQLSVTVSKGETLSATIPANSSPKELRDGVKLETFVVTTIHTTATCQDYTTLGFAYVPYRWFEVVDH
jgi:hypothetical protein